MILITLVGLEDAIMISNSPSNVGGASTANTGTYSSHTVLTSEDPSASRMALLRQIQKSEEASTLILSLWGSEINKSYNSLFGK